MKIVFVSNFFNHHQKPLCDALYNLVGADFSFISTESVPVARIKLGYAKDDHPQYVCQAYLNHEARMRAIRLINEADAVICGSAPADYLKERLRAGKLVLRYSERPYKKKPSALKRLYHAVRFRMRDQGNKNVYLLCASAYTAQDFRSFGMYRNRMYKWGYFPEVKTHDIDRLIDRKKRNSILWCGRYIDWKHPDEAIRLAARLKAEGFDFYLNMIGTGAMEEQLKNMAEAYGLTDVVHFMGAMSPERVRTYMEDASIYLFTSDRQEGWGAVLNEAMASGCAVVANRSIGSVPYLLKSGENGLVYDTAEQLMEYVALLLNHSERAKELGKASYKVMTDLWNADVAANRLLMLIESIRIDEKAKYLFKNGPCSYDDGIHSGTWRKSNFV